MKMLSALLQAALPPPLRTRWLRLRGRRVHPSARIGWGTVLLVDELELGPAARIGHFCLVRAHTLRMGARASVFNFVRIAVHTLVLRSQATVCSQNEIAGDPADARSTLYLGPASWILPHCYVNVARPIKLGRNVGVGGGSYLFTHGMWLSKLDGYPVAYGGIEIDADVWLPWGCFIMPNVNIGTGTIVGACSVVTKPLPPGVLAAGVPAKIVREKSSVDLDPAQRAAILEEITHDLGTRRGRPVRIESDATTTRHWLGDRLLLVLHREAGGAPQPGAINVYFGPLDETLAARSPSWSLADYAGSPVALFDEETMRWFGQARSFGVRLYPIDEDRD